MRNLCIELASVSDAVTTNTAKIDSNQIVSCSFQAVFNDAAAAGSLKIQASNDPYPYGTYLPDNFTPTNWTNIPNATATIAGGVSGMVTIANSCYRWLRANYVPSGFTAAAKASVIIQDLTYEAVTAGVAGNSITVRYLDPGTPAASLSVGVVGSAITVNLATDGSSVLTSTASDIDAAIAASMPANALVAVTVTGTGATVQTAQALTQLVGGAAAPGIMIINFNSLGI